jgi:hypothetical protein
MQFKNHKLTTPVQGSERMNSILPPLLRLCPLALLLSACSNNASHLPSPFELPGALIGTVVENATYGARRQRVKQYVIANYPALRAEAAAGQGPYLDSVMNLAGISAADKRAQVRREFQNDHAKYFPGETAATTDVEPIVVVLMVHS